MQQMMKKMGIQQQEIDAQEVIIKTKDKQLVFLNPQVSRVNMMGQNTFQVIGDPEEKELSTTPEINDDDILTVMEQAKVSKKEAENALKESKGDLAKAIITLQR